MLSQTSVGSATGLGACLTTDRVRVSSNNQTVLYDTSGLASPLGIHARRKSRSCRRKPLSKLRRMYFRFAEYLEQSAYPRRSDIEI